MRKARDAGVCSAMDFLRPCYAVKSTPYAHRALDDTAEHSLFVLCQGRFYWGSSQPIFRFVALKSFASLAAVAPSACRGKSSGAQTSESTSPQRRCGSVQSSHRANLFLAFHCGTRDLISSCCSARHCFLDCCHVPWVIADSHLMSKLGR